MGQQSLERRFGNCKRWRWSLERENSTLCGEGENVFHVFLKCQATKRRRQWRSGKCPNVNEGVAFQSVATISNT